MKASPRFMSPGAVTFLRHRVYEFFGGVLLIIGFLMVMALASYDPLDPSLHTAVSSLPRNFLGSFGAYFSDLLYQWFGLAAFIMPLSAARYGVKSLRHHSVSRFDKELLKWVMVMIGVSSLLAAIPSSFAWNFSNSYGGIAGYIFTQGLSSWTQIPVLFFHLLYWFLAAIGVGGWLFVRRKMLNKGGVAFRKSEEALSEIQKMHKQKHTPPSLSRQVPQEDSSHLRNPKQEQASSLKRSFALSHEEPMKGPEVLPCKDTQELYSQESISSGLLSLLQSHSKERALDVDQTLLQKQAEALEGVLEEFGIKGRIVHARPGPVVTLFELEPSAGIKSSRVIALADDIARSMCAVSARVAIIPGRNAIGIELPNIHRQTVYLKELLLSKMPENAQPTLTLALGKDIGGSPVVADLCKMPHLLLAGTTGSGKSVAVNTMILSLLFTLPPDRCRFIMIDPKMLELSIYDGIPHLLAPVVTDPKKAIVALKWVVKEMEDRYRLMSHLGVRNISGYNQKVKEAKDSGQELMRRVQTGFDPESGKPIFESQAFDLVHLPYIVVVVDEMADLMLVAGKEIESAVQRLAQMARAAGIHLIMATQRPSVDVITGTIKANFPCRISFQVTSKIDSRTILGEQGAEQLLGQGDMLYMASAGRVMRVHGPFVSDREVEAVVQVLKNMPQEAHSPLDITTDDQDDEAVFGKKRDRSSMDPLLDEAIEVVQRERKASTSFVQRYFQIGYNRAARIMEQMEAQGIVGTANNVGRREILSPSYEE